MNDNMVWACVALLVLVGCSKKTPVEEISVADSGIAISDSAPTYAPSDWPAWRGPTGNGVAVDQPLPTTWNNSTNLKWRSDVPGRGHSSPIVIGDAVVLATAVRADEQQMVLAYDRDDGSERWRTVVHQGGFPSQREVHNKATNANGTVASDGQRLFTVMFNSGKIIATALDLDGNQLWQREVGAFNSKFGYAPSPVLYKSLVIIAADNQGGGYLAGLDAETGELAWRTARGNASSYSSPAVGALGGRDQLLISGDDRVASYDPASGEELWSTPCLAEATCGTVVIAGDRAFASGGYPDKETVCLSPDGEKLWSNNTKLYEPSLVAANGLLFGVSDDGIATCWSADDGQRMWRKRLGGNFSSSPVVCNANVYVANLSGECFVFAADGDGLQVVATNRLGDDCYASPAVSDGELFFRVGIGAGNQRKEQLVCVAEE
ncbi:PQQ-binding-like beta-propeller repeat protein [Roseimaritima ulvae]|uniref:Outer membrane biogenesis protein BamB n=1 Tax=Roseimaritima ulvae TaxID=980254 RepID=A0A5B9QKT2_9BACT|nr:PQQ-binding-like beta-propeller repeat protein [Roseimaritima ulvae]QEG38362.1 outer membrane biogenesis protein BamB [Roseimaritima ulvae]